MKYDPAVSPDPAEWLALDEGRIAVVADHHRHARIDLPNVNLHAMIHVVVEQELAGQLEPVVTAFEGLQREGLDRHDAVHVP